ncbi:MAG: hypothetical protein K6T75_07045 [Acetobacteraceae bacterium]|nr:hypothetical protein [Acetobacteraceae bacterium]
MRGRKGALAVAALMVLALVVPACLSGCRPGGRGPGGFPAPGAPAGGAPGAGGGPAPGPPARPTETVQAWSEPWGPVQLSAETARRVVDLAVALSPAPSPPDLRGAWAFRLRRGAGAGGEEMTLYGGGLLCEGRWRCGPAALPVWQAVAAEVCSTEALSALLRAADGVRLVPDDAPRAAVALDGEARLRVAEAARGLGPWTDQPALPPPALYPGYRLEVAAGGRTVHLRWQTDHVVAAWETDTSGYGQADFLDEGCRMWRLLCELAPVPDPGAGAGPARLFLYPEASAEGGPLAQAIEAPPGRVSALVRCLLRASPAAGGKAPPAGEAPVELVFKDPSGRLAPGNVMLYRDGFVLDGRFYEAPGVQQDVLTTMSAG